MFFFIPATALVRCVLLRADDHLHAVTSLFTAPSPRMSLAQAAARRPVQLVDRVTMRVAADEGISNPQRDFCRHLSLGFRNGNGVGQNRERSPAIESHVRPVEDAAAELRDTSGVVVEAKDPAPSKAPRVVKRVTWRDRVLRENGVVRSFTTETPSAESLDGAISALSLLSGLMLTIPYSLMSSMAWEYWDRVQEITSPCPSESERYKRNMRLALTITIYCSCGTLIPSTFYFLFKPRDVARWWKRGRCFLLILVVLTVATVVSLVAVSRLFLNYSAMTSGEICDTFPSLNIAQALLALVAVGGLVVFF